MVLLHAAYTLTVDIGSVEGSGSSGGSVRSDSVEVAVEFGQELSELWRFIFVLLECLPTDCRHWIVE